jgi:hypothetical protein
MDKIFTYTLLFIFIFKGFSQNTINKEGILLKSTITSVGSFTSYPIDEKYKITQSIGQSGIIGTKKSNSIIVQQGFLSNTIRFKIDNSEKEAFEEKLDLILSPNPFIDFIRIDFSRKTLLDIQVQIFDLNGRFIFSENFQPTDTIVIPMKNFAVATYLVLITSGKNNYTKKIIKTD